MTVRRLAEIQPESFAFSDANIAWANKEIAKYPEGRQASTVISLLWRAQEQEGWVSEPAIEVISEMLDMPKIRVLEVATFYTMFHLEPVGRIAHLQVCGTTPCWLRGADDMKAVCRKRIHSEPHHLSDDGAFSWEEVECLGACVNAPLVQIGADTYEDLTSESLGKLLDDLAAGKPVKPGPQTDRQFAAPQSGPTTLSDPSLFDPALRKKEEAARAEVAQAEAPVADEPKPVSKAKPELTPKPEPTPAAKQDAAIAAKEASEPAAKSDSAPAAVKETGPVAEAKPEPAPSVTASAADEGDGEEPEMLSAARDGRADDLKRISGVGPKIEGILNSLGVYHFDQIAAWEPRHVTWVDARLKFKGRIERENWIEQAKGLAAPEAGDG